MNAPIVLDANVVSRKRTAQDLLNDFDEEFEDTEELDESFNELDDTLLDVDNEDNDDSFDESNFRQAPARARAGFSDRTEND